MEGGEGTYTLETLLHFLHVLSVIVWFGGVLALNVHAVRVGSGPDRAAQASLLRLSDVYGRAVIAPAGILTLITGLLMIGEHDLPLSTLWVAWGLIGLLLSRWSRSNAHPSRAGRLAQPHRASVRRQPVSTATKATTSSDSLCGQSPDLAVDRLGNGLQTHSLIMEPAAAPPRAFS